MGLKPLPYLLAVATASNIGSVATITGNPQNMLIGSFSGLSYRYFLWRLGPVALIGLLLDWILIRWLFGDERIPEEADGISAAATHIELRSLRKPAIVVVLVLAGFLGGVPPPMMAAIGRHSCSSHARAIRGRSTTKLIGGFSSFLWACS